MDSLTTEQLTHSDSGNFFLLAGPCAIEGEDMAMRIAERVCELTQKLDILAKQRLIINRSGARNQTDTQYQAKAKMTAKP